MSEKKSKNISDEEWENRILCADESCIGTIGRDGRCRHCGLAYDDVLQQPSDSTLQEHAADDMGEDTGEDSATNASDDYTDSDDEMDDVNPGAIEIDYDDWDSRVLCSDESCIGVIGPDDRCKECGKPR